MSAAIHVARGQVVVEAILGEVDGEEDDEDEEDRIRCRDVCCFTLDEVPFL